MNPSWLDLVRQRLAKHVLPPNYVERVVEELADHLEDLKKENAEADTYSRLGDPEQVAEAAVVTFRRRSFLGRHPTAAFLVFTISPIVPWCVLILTFEMALDAVRYKPGWILSLFPVICSTIVGCLYGELAMWLGIGKKGTLVSCAVLSVIALLCGPCIGWDTAMLLVQFAVPLAAGRWFIERKCSHRHAATKLLVFAISPVVSYTLLWYVSRMVITTTAPLLLHSWLADWGVLLIEYLLLCFFSPVVASLLYCKLAKRFVSGKKWMFVSCAVLATFLAMQGFQRTHWVDAEGYWVWCCSSLWVCIVMAPSLVPLAIGWWFMRRTRDQGQWQLAS